MTGRSCCRRASGFFGGEMPFPPLIFLGKMPFPPWIFGRDVRSASGCVFGADPSDFISSILAYIIALFGEKINWQSDGFFAITPLSKMCNLHSFVETDLNSISDRQLSVVMERINDCYENNKPCIIAANEFPFYKLMNNFRVEYPKI